MIPNMISCYQRGIAVKLEDICSICLTFPPLVLAHCSVSSCKILEGFLPFSFLAV